MSECGQIKRLIKAATTICDHNLLAFRSELGSGGDNNGERPPTANTLCYALKPSLNVAFNSKLSKSALKVEGVIFKYQWSHSIEDETP